MEQPEDDSVEDDAPEDADETEGRGVVEEDVGLTRNSWHVGDQLLHVETKLFLIPRQGGKQNITAAEEEKGNCQETCGFLEMQKAVAGKGCEYGADEIEKVSRLYRDD